MTNKNMALSLPHDDDVEKAMLGCVLYNSAIFDELVGAGITDKHFFSKKNQTVFSACSVLCQKRNGFADLITVPEYIKNGENAALFENVSEYCNGLVDRAVSPAGWKSYAISLDRMYKRRRIITIADKAKECAFTIEEEDSVESLISEISEAFFGEEIKSVKGKSNVEALEEKLKEWQDAIDGKKVYYPCYLKEVEKRLGGFVKGKPYIVAAPPADGKSTFMVNQAEAWARQGIKTAIASLEMEHTELMGIMAAKIAQVSAFALRTAWGGAAVAQSRLDSVHKRAMPQLSADSDIIRNIIINDSQTNIDELCSWIRYMKHREDVKCVFVDYLQIIQAARGFKGSTREIVNDILNKLKIVAKETGVTVIILSQLTKEARKGDRRPHKSDLKESGTIEEIAYGVILLYFWEEKYYADIAKNRGGLNGTVEIDFLKDKQFITDKVVENGAEEKRNSDYHDRND